MTTTQQEQDEEALLTSAVKSSLSTHLDSDVCDYITSMLADDPHDEHARESVMALVAGSLQDDKDDDKDVAEQVCAEFFQLLDFGIVGSNNHKSQESSSSSVVPPLRKLKQSVTLKHHDVETFASGLSAEPLNNDVNSHTTDNNNDNRPSQIAAFYANMIDPSKNNEAAMSERSRRKARQRALRLEMEQEERQRQMNHTLSLLEQQQDDDDDSNSNTDGLSEEQTMMMNASSNDDGDKHRSKDVHLEHFDLPNLRGGGPDLLQNASLVLSSGRRYGLMGRNGCGKTTFLTHLAARRFDHEPVPKNTSMLLVRQEIFGNEWTAVETVLKSDVQRESIKRFIAWCEDELDKLEKGHTHHVNKDGADAAAAVETPTTTPPLKEKSKGRQKLRDRKKQAMLLKTKKTTTTSSDKKENESRSKESVEKKKTQLTQKLARAYERLVHVEQLDGGDPEPRARKVLAGLGFSTDMQDKPTQELSGGWRMRVSLSCALFASPSILLLDEPTNHLDLEAVLWLERYLTTSFQGTLVVVSHDRHFLNQVVTDVVHFHRNKLTTYRGDISNFEAVREEDKQRQLRLREVQESKRAHLQRYIDLHAQAGENGVKAAKQRKSKMKKLDKLGVMAQEGRKWKASYDGDAQEVEEYEQDETVVLKFPDPGPFDNDMVRLEQVTFGYSPDKILLHNVDLSIGVRSRVALLGRNGCGKSTLIKLVVGVLQPLKGKSTIDGRAKIEYLAQHQLEQLDPDSTPMQTMMDRYPGDGGNEHILQLRRYLANFGLGGEILPKQRIHTMSGGQKCRLCLACAMYRKPHLLILDEPTNHLDLETTDALIDAIRNFQGGVLLVSHDQHLLTSVCKHLYVVENGNVELLKQGMSNGEAFQAYKKAVIQGRR